MTKVSGFNEVTTPIKADLVGVIIDVATTPKQRRSTLTNLLKLVRTPVIVAVGDESTILSTGTAKVTFRMPFAFTVTEVRASLTVAGTGAALVTVDINDDGSTLLSTKITIDATEKTSQTAAASPILSPDPFLIADDSEMTIDVDTIDTDNVAAGLKVYLIGFET